MFAGILPKYKNYKNLIHGFCTSRNMRIMKLDLVQINKLSPPGLWDIGVLSAFMACLLRVVDGGVGARLAYGPMVLRFSQELREKVRENLNMRIKAWVLQCPDRTLWVRHVIGEVALRKWRQNRLLDYALTKYFGDWQTKFSGGFTRKDTQKKRNFSTRIIRKIRAYNWKAFSLVKIKNVTGFLYGKPAPDPECEDERAAHLKLWGVDILDAGNTLKSKQPRAKRTVKPIEFTPYELVPEKSEEATEDIVEEAKARRARITLYPVKKSKSKSPTTAIEQPP